MTRRLLTSPTPDWGRYDRLVADAMLAFSEDVTYAVQVMESARSVSEKKKGSSVRKIKPKK